MSTCKSLAIDWSLERGRADMNRIVFATDASVSTSRTKDVVHDLLVSCPTANLSVLYVMPDKTPDEIPLSTDEWTEEFGNRVSLKHVYGKAVSVISSEAQEQHADLVVLGARQVVELDAAITGSAAHGMLFMSSIPMMIARDESPV
jgi:nucleotide-binding universal stress UspA family protein